VEIFRFTKVFVLLLERQWIRKIAPHNYKVKESTYKVKYHLAIH